MCEDISYILVLISRQLARQHSWRTLMGFPPCQSSFVSDIQESLQISRSWVETLHFTRRLVTPQIIIGDSCQRVNFALFRIAHTPSTIVIMALTNTNASCQVQSLFFFKDKKPEPSRSHKERDSTASCVGHLTSHHTSTRQRHPSLSLVPPLFLSFLPSFGPSAPKPTRFL